MQDSSPVSSLLSWLRSYGQRAVNSLLIDERRCIPPHIVLEFGNHGLFGLQIGREYGGLNLSTCDTLAVMRQLGAIDLTLATLVSTHANGLYAVQHHGSEALKQQFLPQFASGRQLCGFGLTEEVAGSNPWAIQMSAHALPAGGWRLHGRKIWVDSGAWASLLTLFAQTRDPVSGAASISAFAVPLNGEGVVIETEALTMGLRGMVQNHVRLHYSVVQPHALLGQTGQGMAIAQQALNVGRLMLAAKSIGATGHCLQLMIRYARQRQVATGRLLDNPVIRSWIGDLNARMQAAQCLAWQLGRDLDLGVAVPQEVIFALKNAAVDTLWDSADLALQTLGGRGYMENNVLPQILRDARTMRISEGPTETLNMAIGATLVNAAAPLLEFMRVQLGAPALAQQLQDAIEPLLKRLGVSQDEGNLPDGNKADGNNADDQHGGFDSPQASLNWAYALLGQTATCALLLAALEHECAQAVRLASNEEHARLLPAVRCLQAQFAAQLRDVQQAGAAEVASLAVPDLANLLAQMEADIGQPGQTAAGVDTALDPMLTLQAQEVAPPPCRYWQQPYQHYLACLPLHLYPDFARSNAAPDFATLHQPWPSWQERLQPALAGSGLHPDTLLLAAWLVLLQGHTGQAQMGVAYAPASVAGQPADVLPVSLTLPELLADMLNLLDAQLALARQMRHSPSLPGHDFLDRISLLLARDQVPPVAMLPSLEIMLCVQQGACIWVFDQHLFTTSSIERLHAGWQTVVSAMLDALTQRTAESIRLDTLPLMPAAARQQLLHEFNQTHLPIAGEHCVHHLFEQQARLQGAAIAATCGAQQISFASLNRHANRVARQLLQSGVVAGDFVGLCVRHSPEMLVGLLAILKTGAAYIPLDPDYPQQRLKFVLEDSGMRHVLTCADWQASLPEHHATVVLMPHLAEDGTLAFSQDQQGGQDGQGGQSGQGGQNAAAENVAGGNVAGSVSPHSTAYVLYTSGSTGLPKGVRVSHAALANFLHAMQQRLQLGPQDMVLAHTTLAFDIAGLEIFMPLAWGCSMLLPPASMRRDPVPLCRYVQEHRVTLIQATPAMWHLLLLAGWSGNDDLVALCGGEALSLDLAQQLVGKCKRLWNMYGPTEATIWCAMQMLEPGMLNDPHAGIPIGKPIANTRFYVLDPQQRLLPPGVPGELCVGGENLAQGYWQRPQIEQEKFFIWRDGQQHGQQHGQPDGQQDGQQDGQRLYRTGDLVRWRSDGVLLFMGRQDRQIKLRGYRIEPGEIEYWLCTHPEVQEAVVISVQRGSHDVMLVAFVQSAEPVAAETLRQLLEPHVPPYMLPNLFVCLPALPLTANGKIDHLALPALLPQSALAEPHAAPDAQAGQALANPLQQRLRQLWAETLQMAPERIAPDSHFFAIGGHSLLAAQIVSRLNHRLHINLSLADFFNHPSINALAQCIEQDYLGAAAQPGGLPQAIPGSSASPVPLIHAQKAGIFKLKNLFADQANIFNSSLAWRLQGEIDLARLEQALHLLHARHPILSTRFQHYDGALNNITQLCKPQLPLPLLRHDLRQQNEQRDGQPQQASAQDPAVWQRLMAEFEHQLFDMERGPLVRVQLILLAHDCTILQIVFHHLIIDGPATAVFLAELSALYADPAAHLPAPPIEFADYALWEAAHGAPPEMHAYWKRYMTPLPPRLVIPQLPDDAVPTREVGGQAVRVAATTLAGIQQLAQQQNATLFMLLMSAFVLVLARHSREQDMTIGYPMGNRAVPGTEALVSCLAITMPIRLHCSPGASVQDLLPQVHANLSANLKYGNADFATLVDELGVATRVNGLVSHPLFQILFLLEERIAPVFDGIQLQALPGHPLRAKYDLLLYAQLSGQAGVDRQLDLYFQYHTGVFNAATVVMLAREVNELLDALVAGQAQATQCN